MAVSKTRPTSGKKAKGDGKSAGKKKFRFKTKPREWQLEEFKKFRNHPKRALLWAMRTGKTKAMVDLAAYQGWKGEITGVIVLAPNGVHDNWVRRELPKHCPISYKAAVYRSSSRTTRWHVTAMENVCKPEKGKLSVLTINSESMWRDPARKLLRKFIIAHKKKVMLIVDESHDYRTPGSKRSRACRSLAKSCKFVRIMTGTPVANSPLHAWSQFEILQPSALGFKTFGAFRAHHAVYELARTKGGRQFEKLVCYMNQDELTEKISKWASVIVRSDMLSKLIKARQPIGMTDAQKKLYERLIKEYILEDAAYDGGARMTKLQQIARGWYYDEDREVIDVVSDDNNPALIELRRQIEATEGKIIIWAAFRPEIEKICKMLGKMGINYVRYQGGMKGDEKAKARTKFMENPAVRVFVGQPKAGGTGIELSSASTIIWFSHVHDLIDYEQASERATVVEGKPVDVVHFEVLGTVDTFILDTHDDKRDVADTVAGEGLRNVLLELEFV